MEALYRLSSDQLITPGITGDTRKPYSQPALIILGDLRTTTLSGSPGGVDDGGGGTYQEVNPYATPPGYPIDPTATPENV